MVANLGAAHAAEKFLCPIRASAIVAMGFLMVDAPDLETLIQLIPRIRFVGVEGGALENTTADEIGRMALVVEHGG